MDTTQGQVLWLARMALIAAGNALAARGYGDAELWQGVTGTVLTLAGLGWSYYERRRALATVPAPVAQAAAVAAASPYVPTQAADVLATVAQASGAAGGKPAGQGA